MTPRGSMWPAAIAASMPLTSSGAAAEMRWTLATGIKVSSAARRVRLIVASDGALKLAQRRRERHALSHRGAQSRQQIVAHRRVVDAEHTAFANDRTPGDDQLIDVAHGGAGKQKIERVEVRPQPLGINHV